MLHFEVGHYSVRTELQRVQTSAGVQTYAARVLTLTGRPGPDAAIFRATLQFSTLFEPWYSRATAGQFDRSAALSPRLSVWLPLGEFPCYYDILRNERPLYLAFEAQPDGSLSHVHLGSTMSADDLPVDDGMFFRART
jgi:hypothetical protein